MLYGLVCIAALFLLVYWIMNGILKVTGWTDPQERRAAALAAMTAAILNSSDTKK